MDLKMRHGTSLLFAFILLEAALSSSAYGGYVTRSHYDCVGPAATPLTTGPVSTETFTFSGWIFGSNAVYVDPVLFALAGSGYTCPVTVSAPESAPEDFTGHYDLTVACGAGTTNAGAVTLQWSFDAVAGGIVSFTSGPITYGPACNGTLGHHYSLDLTISISSTSLLGAPIPAIGGVLLNASQLQ